jgi:hypothetical protein
MPTFSGEPMYRFLMVLTIAAALGLQGWRTLFNNFAVDIVGVEGWQVGIIQSIREVTGFLALLVVYVMMIMREHRLSVPAILVLGIGTGTTGLFPTFTGLIVTTMIMSFGFHYYETTNQSLTLQYFDPLVAPVIFGRQRSYATATNIVVGLAIYLAAPRCSYATLYLVLGAILVMAGIWGFRQDPCRIGLPHQHRRMIFRRRYWLFYFLTFMAGARRQIFIAFSVFLLVKRFGFTVQEITLLFVLNNASNYFISPLVGRAIVRYCERRVLSLE